MNRNYSNSCILTIKIYHILWNSIFNRYRTYVVRLNRFLMQRNIINIEIHLSLRVSLTEYILNGGARAQLSCSLNLSSDITQSKQNIFVLSSQYISSFPFKHVMRFE